MLLATSKNKKLYKFKKKKISYSLTVLRGLFHLLLIFRRQTVCIVWSYFKCFQLETLLLLFVLPAPRNFFVFILLLQPSLTIIIPHHFTHDYQIL